MHKKSLIPIYYKINSLSMNAQIIFLPCIIITSFLFFILAYGWIFNQSSSTVYMICYGAISMCFRLTTGFRDSDSLVNPEYGFKNFFSGKTLGMTENEQKKISRGMNSSESLWIPGFFFFVVNRLTLWSIHFCI